MSLAKTAQSVNYDGISIPLALDDSHDLEINESDDELYLDEGGLLNPDEGALMVEETPQGFVFELPTVPGGDFQDELEDPSAIEVEDEEIEVESDPWKWNVASFLEWLQDKMGNIPRHSGRDSSGCERAIAYLEQLDREISRAVRMDLNNEIAIDAVEKARDEINNGIDRLQDRLDKVNSSKYKRKKKKKKKADENHDMVKEGSKGAFYGKVVVTIPMLISGIARACINSMVSAGKDIEDEFQKLAKQYDLDKREQFMLYQTLSDMGYHVRRPRGSELDAEIDYTSTENTGWAQNFPG